MNPLSNLSSTFNIIFFARACLKKAFRELRVSVCGRFYPNEGGVAGYGNRMRVKSPAKWGLQIAEMIFQTRSSILFYPQKNIKKKDIPLPDFQYYYDRIHAPNSRVNISYC